MSKGDMEHLVEPDARSWCEPIETGTSASASERPGSADGLRLYAPAKINLNLLVGRRREDGYHPLDSLVAKITLYDQIEMHLRDDGRVNFTSEGLDCGDDSQNLAYAAARVLAKNRKVPGADIVLEKRIPPGSGLGGGSSDAAVVLSGLNDLWKLNLPAEELSSLGAGLGSDVPLFLAPAASRITNRGETVQPIDAYPFWAVLVLPDIACATGAVYDAFDTGSLEMGRQLDVSLFCEPPSKWRTLLVNQLLPAALSLTQPLGELYETLTAATDLPVCLTGSGSAMFILCDDKAEAMSVLSHLPPTIHPLSRIVRRNSW